MSDGRWGGDLWSDSEWAGGDAVAHSLSARAGIVAGAKADRIGSRQALVATATVRSATYGIGAGPAAIHPLRANAVIETVATAGPLRKQHPLVAAATLRSATGTAALRMQHPLQAEAAIAVTAGGRLSIRHPLEASAQVGSTAEASGLVLGHPLVAVAFIITAAGAIYTIEIPEILEPTEVDPQDPGGVVPGAINLISNPIAALGLTGWTTVDDATVTIDDVFAWDGGQSVRVEPGSDGSGVMVSTPRPLGLAILEGSVVWGQAMVALNLVLPEPEPLPEPDPEDPIPPAEPEPPVIDPLWITGWVEVQYSDGSIDAGDAAGPFPIVATGYQADWDIFVASFSPDVDKVVVEARLFVVSDVEPSIPTAFWIGGTQLEYDRWMLGPQPVRSDTALVQTQRQTQEAV